MLNFFKNSKKILGMNSRNLEFIRPNNLSWSKRLADDKLLSKKILHKNKLAVPKLLARITTHEELENFDWNILPKSFVLKPASGFGGEGIVVVYGKRKGIENVWVKADRSSVTVDDLKNHIRNILDGFYSLSNTPDTAFFEERLLLLKLFKPYSYRGIPDIRVIVYNKVPVMAMLRLPTKESNGKANLQQGAVGVGIDMATGTTTTAVQGKHKVIEYAPEARLLLSGVKIPYWDEILKLAVKAQEVSRLGFLGADVAIDKERGPVFLELNARPGLSIQVANLSGLKERLDRVAGLKIKSIERGVAVGKNLFGGEIEENVESMSGKRVIGSSEMIKLLGRNEKKVEVEAKIDTGAGFTAIDIELAKKLGFEKTIEEFDKKEITYKKIKLLNKNQRKELLKNIPGLADTVIIHSSHGTTYRPMVRVNITMDKTTIPAKVSIIDRSNLKYSVIIGKKNLGRFLINVNN